MTSASENPYHKRRFSKQDFFTDLRIKYETKKDARKVMEYLKTIEPSVRARVVKRKGRSEDTGGIFLYVDSDTHEKIKSGVIDLVKAGTAREELQDKQKLKSKRKSSRSKRKSKKRAQSGKKKKRGSAKRTTKTKGKKQTDKKPKTPDRYFETINDVPQYLLDRVSSDAQSIMKMGVLSIDGLSKKKVQKYIDILRAEQIKYDITFQKEKEIIDFMNEMALALNEKLQEYQEQEAEEYMSKYYYEYLEKGKFDKYLAQIDSKGIDEVAYLIFKKMGWKTRKYPFKDNHLIKNIKKKLEQREE